MGSVEASTAQTTSFCFPLRPSAMAHNSSPELCLGYIWGVDSGEKLTRHMSERRDRWCKNCTHRAAFGQRLISGARLRIIPGVMIVSRQTTCQQSMFDFGSLGSITIKKRHIIDGPEDRLRLQHLVFNPSLAKRDAPVQDSCLSITLIDHQEVGGSETSDRYAVGGARVPPKHFGA